MRATAQQSQQPSFWASSCEVVTIYTNGYTGMTPDEIAKAIADAAHVWSPEMVTCPTAAGDGGAASGHPTFEIITQMAAGGSAPSIGPDGKNVLIFRTDGWEYGEAIALTSRNTNPSGRIFDADLEVNALPFNDYVWANLDPNAPPAHGGLDQIDLQMALTHEFGHFLGLGHTCFVQGSDPLPYPLDDQGRPIPQCGADESIPEAAAVMWWQVQRDSTDQARPLDRRPARRLRHLPARRRRSPSAPPTFPTTAAPARPPGRHARRAWRYSGWRCC